MRSNRRMNRKKMNFKKKEVRGREGGGGIRWCRRLVRGGEED